MKHDDAQPARLSDDEITDAFCKMPHPHQFVAAFHAGARFAEQRVRAALAARAGEAASADPVELGSRAEPKSDALGSANRAKVDAEQGWRRECDDTDAVLRLIGLDPEQCRTDGGSLNVPKIGSLLRDRATALAYLCPAGCGCTWRDNGDGSMSLYGPSSRSCAVCETMPLSKLLPLFAAPPALHEAARLALEALENCSSEHGHRCNRCDSEVDEGGTIADALRAALAAEQPQSEPVSGGYIDPDNVARRARGIERVHEIMGEFVEQDGDGLICPKQPFSWETVAGIAMSYLGWHLAGPNPAPPPSAPEPSEAEVEFARGIDAAARFVEKRLADYDAAHGSTDSDTGAREYPGTGDEYVCELAEIAEAIRGLAPPPAAPAPSGWIACSERIAKGANDFE